MASASAFFSSSLVLSFLLSSLLPMTSLATLLLISPHFTSLATSSPLCWPFSSSSLSSLFLLLPSDTNCSPPYSLALSHSFNLLGLSLSPSPCAAFPLNPSLLPSPSSCGPLPLHCFVLTLIIHFILVVFVFFLFSFIPPSLFLLPLSSPLFTFTTSTRLFDRTDS